MARTMLIHLPWNGTPWPGWWADGLPTFRFRMAPPGVVTRRQLRARGMCPGGQDLAGQLLWRAGRRWAGLFLIELAVPSPGATTAQLAALAKAHRALRTCRACGSVSPYRLPTSSKRRCWPCTELPGHLSLIRKDA